MGNRVCAVLLTVVLCGYNAHAQSSLSQQAAEQYRTAEKAEATLNEKPQEERTRAEHLDVIKAYDRVYRITPHTAWADNALASIARLYEEISEPQRAIKTLQFLLREYPKTPLRDVAQQDILRLSGADTEVSKGPNAVENIRFWESEGSVRVVVDLTGEVTFKRGDAKSPDRFYLDITPARLNSMLKGKEWVVDSPSFQKIRVAQFDESTVRVVLDGATAKRASSMVLKDPNRIVIDVGDPAPNAAPALPRTTARPAAEPAASRPESAKPEPTAPPALAYAGNPAADISSSKVVTPAQPTNRGDRSLIRALGLKLNRVVIDAGHGGHDTGSIGSSGLTEKELVLDVAKRLQSLIESEMGAEVVMTRTEDIFVSLESRPQIANKESADLFISIHANSSPTRTVRGVETFFLNLNMQSRDALNTANRENAASELGIHQLQAILNKILLKDKVDESRELAEHIQSAMSKRPNAGANRGVKPAPFVVLLGAEMPSVLAEISFISNPEEERKLKTPDYRQQIAESLLQGIRSYAGTLSGTKTAQSNKD